MFCIFFSNSFTFCMVHDPGSCNCAVFMSYTCINSTEFHLQGAATRSQYSDPTLQQAWATGELIDELAATRQAFGYTVLARSTPPLATGTQPTASTSCQPDDLLPRQPAPKTVQYQPPSFKLTRPTMRLTIVMI